MLRYYIFQIKALLFACVIIFSDVPINQMTGEEQKQKCFENSQNISVLAGKQNFVSFFKP